MVATAKEKVANCIKERANWGVLKQEHRFDHKSFNPAKTKKDLLNASPKLTALLNKIKELDEQDMKKHGKLFKHFIYSDVKSAYGAKLIASGLTAAGFKHAYELKQTPRGMSFALNKFTGKSNTFATLTSVAFFEKPIGINFRKELLGAFNQRPDNIQGKNIRIIILDSGFREGIDLFDIKYVHLFEPIITASDEKQAIGRATRFCGQKGLNFDPLYGWPLHVFRYETTIPEDIKRHLTSFNKDYDADSFFQLFLKFSNIDHKKLTFANQLEKVTVETAVDKLLTQEIHEFKVPPASGGSSASLSKVEKLQQNVATKYAEFKWAPVKIENTCGQAGGAVALSFTPTQEFVRRYFTPRYPHPGMLLWHSVGTGKLCTAISTLTTTFEPEDYTILYVTRYTLKGEVWKNVFDQTCSLVIQDMLKQGKTIPEAQAAKLRLLSKGWFEPMSYRQLSNLLDGKNKLSEKLYQLNGKEDPLRKTVIVIDEAHKLFAADVEGQEKADMDVLRNAFMHSNRVSGKDGVKLLFMTATPYTSEPMDLMRLLNLLRPADEQLPETFEEFATAYLDETGSFTPAGKVQYQNQIAGYISYLNREKDIRSFSYPLLHDIHVPMSKYEYMDILTKFTIAKEKYQSANQDLSNNKQLVEQDTEMYKKKLKNELQVVLKPRYDEYKDCLAQTVLNVTKYKKQIKDIYSSALKQCKEDATNTVKALKEEYKNIIKQVRTDLKNHSKGKSKEEKDLLKRKADKQIENLKLDQAFDTEQVFQNAEYLTCTAQAEQVYQEALQNMPTSTTKEQCDAMLAIIKEVEAEYRTLHAELVEQFRKSALDKFKYDEEQVLLLKNNYNTLNKEKETAIANDTSQLTGLEKCLAPKVKPLYNLILSGDSIPDKDDTPEEEEEQLPEETKRNIFLISGHGSEKVIKFNRRNVMPEDKVLIVFPVCARPNYMDIGCKFVQVMENPANKKYIENPIKYQSEITRLLGHPIRIYLPGEYVPEMANSLFLDFSEGSKVIIGKSGVLRMNGWKEMDRSILKEAKKPEYQLGTPLCKPFVGVIDSPQDYTGKVHKEVFKGNLFKPAAERLSFQQLRHRSFSLKYIMEETGPGIYYYLGCRSSMTNVPPEEYAEVRERSEEQQEKGSRKKKILPVLPFIKAKPSSGTPMSSEKASSSVSSEKKSTASEKRQSQSLNKEEKKILLLLQKEIKKTFQTLENVATNLPLWREKLAALPQSLRVQALLHELTILEELDKNKDNATKELKVKEEKGFFHFMTVSVLRLNKTKYTFKPVTYGYIPAQMREVSEKCSSTNLRKKIISFFKKGRYLSLPQTPTMEKEAFLEICRKVKLD